MTTFYSLSIRCHLVLLQSTFFLVCLSYLQHHFKHTDTMHMCIRCFWFSACIGSKAQNVYPLMNRQILFSTNSFNALSSRFLSFLPSSYLVVVVVVRCILLLFYICGVQRYQAIVVCDLYKYFYECRAHCKLAGQTYYLDSYAHNLTLDTPLISLYSRNMFWLHFFIVLLQFFNLNHT